VNATQADPWAGIPTTPQPKMKARFYDPRGVLNHTKVGPAEEVLDEIRNFCEAQGTDPDWEGVGAGLGKIVFNRAEAPGFVIKFKGSVWGARNGASIRIIVGPDPNWIGVEKFDEDKEEFVRWNLLSVRDTLTDEGWFEGRNEDPQTQILTALVGLGYLEQKYDPVAQYRFTKRGRNILLRGE
jgi:hypothetical protein